MKKPEPMYKTERLPTGWHQVKIRFILIKRKTLNLSVKTRLDKEFVLILHRSLREPKFLDFIEKARDLDKWIVIKIEKNEVVEFKLPDWI